MPISSSSLFHFTSQELDGIRNILKNGFRVSYSDEVEFKDNITIRKAIPMVCFCDIPISLIKSHSQIYCSSQSKVFGIGMKKEWAVKNKLNPIIYISENSYLSGIQHQNLEFLQHYYSINTKLDILKGSIFDKKLVEEIEIDSILKKYSEIAPGILIKGIYNFAFFAVFDIISKWELFIKPISGKYLRNGNIVNENHNFYNEREWRYISPTLSEIRISREPSDIIQTMSDNSIIKKTNIIAQLNDTQYGEINSSQYDKFLKQSHEYEFLTFAPEDISFIIANDQSAVNDLIGFILSDDFNICNTKPKFKNELISKILSWEQIENDILAH